MKRTWMKHVCAAVIFAFGLAIVPAAAAAADQFGKLRGFVYGDDGKKPLPDAIVLLRETTSQRICQSEKTRKNGAYVIENILPGAYAVGIQWDKNDFNVDVVLKLEPKKQLACFTLPKETAMPGYPVRCQDPACFFVTPCGWAVVAGATAGITYGIIKIIEKEASPTGI